MKILGKKYVSELLFQYNAEKQFARTNSLFPNSPFSSH
jgi:hypothetical protein